MNLSNTWSWRDLEEGKLQVRKEENELEERDYKSSPKNLISGMNIHEVGGRVQIAFVWDDLVVMHLIHMQHKQI